jgi:hypothetical protein
MHKIPRGKSQGLEECQEEGTKKQINTSTKSLNHASIQGNIQGNDQATLHTKEIRSVVNALKRGT